MVETYGHTENGSQQQQPWGGSEAIISPITSERPSSNRNDKRQTNVHVPPDAAEHFAPG
jgi:hypothetical protein